MAEQPNLLIRGGRVIDPVSGRDETADVLIAGPIIRQIGAGLDAPEGTRVLGAEGCLVTPGLIDPHVHLREPGQLHKSSIESGSAAAVSGGFSSICCMPNTDPPIDSPELVRFVRARAEQTARCRVFPVACGTAGRRGERPAEIVLCAGAGAVAISDDGDAVAEPAVMRRVLEATRHAGLAFMQHCQEPTLTEGASMHAGSVAARLGLTGWPREAEELILERDTRLVGAMHDPCRYHAQHLSSAGSVEVVRQARKRGLPVTAEASPHHLTLTHEACLTPDGLGADPMAKVNPPLREPSDTDALRRGVAEGVITVLATDHAPHAHHDKDLAFEHAAFGLVGLETALPLYAEALVCSDAITWPRLIQMLTLEPARLCGLDARGLGMLAVGGPADVTVIDPDLEWTLGPETFAGRAANTPLLGRRLTGRAVTTVVAGRVEFCASD